MQQAKKRNNKNSTKKSKKSKNRKADHRKQKRNRVFNDRLTKEMIVMFTIWFCLVSASETNLNLRFSENKIRIQKYGDFDIILYDNGLNNIGKQGYPSLPVLSILIAAPFNTADADIEIKNIEWRNIPGEFNIYPIQPPLPLSDIQVESKFVPPDINIYEKDLPYPAEIVSYRGIGNRAEFKLVKVLLCPFQYFPKTKKLNFVEQVTLRITYKTTASCKPRTHFQIKSIANSIKKMVINPEDVDKCLPLEYHGGKGSPYLNEGDYKEVYITSTSLAPLLDPIVDWRTKQGIPCTTVTVSNIISTYPGWDAPEKIRNFIKDADTTWGTLYFTLAGDTGAVPTRILINQLGSTVATDLYFSDLDSTWDADGDHIYAEEEDSSACDWFSDVFVGRLATSTEEHINTFLWKIFTYEKNPPSGYLKKCLLPASYLWPPYGADQVNDSIANCTPADWQDSKLYEMLGNVNHQITLDSLNVGFGFVHFGGHGNLNGIYWDEGVDTFLYNTDVPLLNNGDKLGVYNSIACFPGGFDTDTSVLNDDCLAENLMNCPTGGPVAVIMNSRVGLGTPPSMGPSEKLDLEFYRKVFREGTYIIGDAHSTSKDVYVPASDTAEHYLFCILELNLFGDPAMPMWLDTPLELFVDHPDSITTTQNEILITVTDSRAPVPNALVCLMSKQGEIYEYDYTDANGQVLFTINPTIPDTLWVTTTAKNHLPYEGYSIIYEGNPGVEEESSSGVFTLTTPCPSIIDKSVIINYSIPERNDVCITVLDVTGRNLGTLVNCRQKKGRHILVWDGTINTGKLSAGIYFLKLRCGCRTAVKKIIIL
ncbi:MAG TPA: hypothetical protein ENI34_01060 [candidate division WOR-3 bacterium]|uniref:T9SS type A sorting domain-containing protein n=1 Tax=candidate division WOR-3 bacterium TaxID=2052148 RepID=A0A9C9EKZ4_UNCW3|nr:hypothetical protein [candidate division WOR-3 bacterium]